MELEQRDGSLPPRGAWIEMLHPALCVSIPLWSLPPRGAWIEICPCRCARQGFPSLPPRGAWIEIINKLCYRRPLVSLPPRGAWIEMIKVSHMPSKNVSLPPRGAWIEIAFAWVCVISQPRRSPHGERGLKYVELAAAPTKSTVAPPTGSVD